MRAIETTARVEPDGTLTARVPADVPAGEHHVVLMIDEAPVSEAKRDPLDFPVHDLGPWPASLSLRREDLYDDFGR